MIGKFVRFSVVTVREKFFACEAQRLCARAVCIEAGQEP